MSTIQEVNNWFQKTFPYNQTMEVIDSALNNNKIYYKLLCSACKNIKLVRNDSLVDNGCRCNICEHKYNLTKETINRANINMWYNGDFKLMGDGSIACNTCGYVENRSERALKYIRRACKQCVCEKLVNIKESNLGELYVYELHNTDTYIGVFQNKLDDYIISILPGEVTLVQVIKSINIKKDIKAITKDLQQFEQWFLKK